MPEFLKQQVFGGLRFIDVVVLAVGVIVVLTILGRLYARFKDPTIKSQVARFRCTQCGWSGMGSKHTMRCPKCGNKQFVAA